MDDRGHGDVWGNAFSRGRRIWLSLDHKTPIVRISCLWRADLPSPSRTFWPGIPIFVVNIFRSGGRPGAVNALELTRISAQHSFSENDAAAVNAEWGFHTIYAPEEGGNHPIPRDQAMANGRPDSMAFMAPPMAQGASGDVHRHV
jgi:hypothetical protein